TVTYLVQDGDPVVIPVTERDTFPAPPAGATVEGFSITFTSDGDGIAAGEYTRILVGVTAEHATETRPATNKADIVVENTDGLTGTDSDEVPFQTDPLTVRTEASKTIAPNELWGLPGVDRNLQI